MIQVEKPQQPQKPQAKTIEIANEDLVITCKCRKVTLHVRGGKKQLRDMDGVFGALREACTEARVCECNAMLVNTGGLAHD